MADAIREDSGERGDALPEGFRAVFEAAESADERDQAVERFFEVRPVAAMQDVDAGVVYYARDKQPHLIRAERVDSQPDLLAMSFVLSGQRAKPVPRRTFFELASKSGLRRLTPRKTTQPGNSSDDQLAAASEADLFDPEPADGGATGESHDLPVDPKKLHPESTIDLSTLTQLLTAARQSGIVSNPDAIAHVRDCEFRMGKYQRALDTIERVYVKFGQAATQRDQQLRAEEIRYRSGALKMTPKQWMQKKQRDTAQTTAIERTRRKFAHVLDGLRLLARVTHEEA